MSVAAQSVLDAPAPRWWTSTKPLQAFMIPSVFGDEPQLADLRRRVREVLVLDTLDLPDVHARGRLLTDMAATAGGLRDEILRRRPTGSIALLGFSFGASMALEVAGQLERAGRHVSFLAILDGPFEPPELPKPGTTQRHRGASHRLAKSLVVGAVEGLDVLRRLALLAAARKGPDLDPGEPMRRAMLWHLRNKALSRWKPQPCMARGLHVSSGDYGARNRERWAELCPNLDHVEVPAVHEDLLKSEALKAVAALLKAAVKARRS